MNNYDIFITSNIPKPLPKKELLDCLKKVSCGDSEAREKVIMHNMRLVFDRIYKKFYNVNYDKNELFSIGIIGLIKSVDTFNINKEIEFSVYAIRCIDNEILMFLRKLKKYSIEDSLESKIGEYKDGNVLSLLDILADDYDFTEEYMKKELLISIRKIVDQLEGRDKEIIMLRFGFLDGKIYVQEEVATKLNISRSYVSRLEKKILKRIYNTLENNEYIDRIGLGFKVEENNVDEDENEMRKIQTIYQYFSEYTKEEIDLMVVKLNDRDRQLLKLRYGEDLENPQSIRLSGVESKKFCGSLVPKMKGLLTKIRQENYIQKNYKVKIKKR